MILRLRWLLRMLVDIVLLGFVNGSFGMSLALLALLVIGLTMVVAQVSQAFIYTLF